MKIAKCNFSLYRRSFDTVYTSCHHCPKNETGNRQRVLEINIFSDDKQFDTTTITMKNNSTTTDKLPRSRFQKRPQQVTGAATTQHVSDDDDHGSDMCWCPRPMVFFQFVLSARITASFFSNISDCDETFNYWEPTHYLLYGKCFVFFNDDLILSRRKKTVDLGCAMCAV